MYIPGDNSIKTGFQKLCLKNTVYGYSYQMYENNGGKISRKLPLIICFLSFCPLPYCFFIVLPHSILKCLSLSVILKKMKYLLETLRRAQSDSHQVNHTHQKYIYKEHTSIRSIPYEQLRCRHRGILLNVVPRSRTSGNFFTKKGSVLPLPLPIYLHLRSSHYFMNIILSVAAWCPALRRAK